MKGKKHSIQLRSAFGPTEGRRLKRDSLFFLARAAGLKRLLPDGIKTALLKYLPYDRYMRHVWAREAPFPGIEEVSNLSAKGEGAPRDHQVVQPLAPILHGRLPRAGGSLLHHRH